MNDCGCCDRGAPVSPRTIFNRPALSALSYRVATFSSFRRAMIDALASEPALRGWTTRSSDDYGIEVIELWAYLGDVLTFYEERIANEAFLRTAVQRDSLLRLAALIDYKLAPGVAATAYLAFLLEKNQQVQIPARLRVQSKPAPGQLPATFETEEPIAARTEWGTLKPRLTKAALLQAGDTQARLSSMKTGLKPGEMLLFFNNGQWDAHRVTTVVLDPLANETAVEWDGGLTWHNLSPTIQSAPPGYAVFALRQRASIFGHNAGDWRMLPDTLKASYLGLAGERQLTAQHKRDWPDYTIFAPSSMKAKSIPRYPYQTPQAVAGALLEPEEALSRFQPSQDTLDLDQEYRQITANGWLLLSTPDRQQVFQVSHVTETTRSEFMLTSKVTRLTLGDAAQLAAFDETVRAASVYAQSEPLELAPMPVTDVLAGDVITLDQLVHGLEAGRTLIVQGQPAGSSASAAISEAVTLKAVSALDQQHTQIVLTHPLRNQYIRSTVSIMANAVRATHGESIKDEILGSGDGALPSQTFDLKKSPVTFTPDKTAERGALSSLQVMVNGVRWKEAPNFFGRAADERIYVASIDDSNAMHVEFGDGVHGARLPSGAGNIHARYRKGWGKAGSVAAAKLTSLLDTRPGLKSVSNPAPSFGWAEPETVAQARRNAPATVLTFDRAVSLLDFENLARSYPGVGKARASYVWNDEQQVVRLTCAASDGASILPIQGDLQAYLDARRDPNRQLEIVDFKPAGIKLHAFIVADPDYDQAAVLASAQAAIGTQPMPDDTYGFFAFERLDLDEDIHLSEVYAALQNVAGVVAVEIVELRRADASAPALQNIVPIGPAELAMVLDPSDVVVELKDEL